MTTTANPGTGRPDTDVSGIQDSWTVTEPLRVVEPAPRAVWTPAPRVCIPASDAPTVPIPVVPMPPAPDSTPTEPLSVESHATRPATRSLGSRLVDWGLNILAVFGVLCIALTVLAFVGNYTIVMFKTGSMDPTIPQGSIAVVHEIPATEVKVGDIITVDRGVGLKPITHRAIAVKQLGGGEALIDMQGDANPNPDPEPYRVSQVRKVVWHAPGLAKQIVWLSNPYVLGAITLGAALLVLWAFWPKSPNGRREDETADSPRS
ncbi:signal peptidase I [Gordonia rubripertincta]|uniref:signal peptidase I n=1 Tax=Gordonia rubripertincta TaxID=36822 RepID=UPI0015F8D49A|nr:signal peptidase I [Gordonia rubripertincta]QMU19255.1 signal peptidase I [Gordonia rubripertincta]